MLTEEDTKRNIGLNLARILELRGRSPYWLMKQLNMKEGSFYPVARGTVMPSVFICARIAETLDISIDQLIKNPEESLIGCT